MFPNPFFHPFCFAFTCTSTCFLYCAKMPLLWHMVSEIVVFFVSFKFTDSPQGGELLASLQHHLLNKRNLWGQFLSFFFFLSVWCSVSHWQIVSGWWLEETQPPVSFLWHVSARNMLVEGREKGTDNISMSNLKFQHPCYASSRMLLNSDSLCQWREVTKFQLGLKIKFSYIVSRLE